MLSFPATPSGFVDAMSAAGGDESRLLFSGGTIYVKDVGYPQAAEIVSPGVAAPTYNAARVSIEKWGITGDGSDCTDKLQTAFASGEALEAKPGTYKISDSLYIPQAYRNGFTWVGAGGTKTYVNATALGSKPLFIADPSATPGSSTRRQFACIEDLYIVGPGKAVAGSVGLMLNNLLVSAFSRLVITGFERGVVCDGLELVNGTACYYNDFYSVRVTGCDIAWTFAGQANSNKVFGGRAFGSRIGVLITKLTNDVYLSGVDIEGNTEAGLWCDGYGNAVMGCRFENTSAPYEIVFNELADSTVTTGTKNTIISYQTGNNLDLRILDNSPTKDNLIMWPGQLKIGNPATTAKPSFLAYRTSPSNLSPAIDIQDRYSTSGRPIGYRHLSARLGGIAMEAQNFSAGAFRTYLRGTYDSTSGHAQMWFGAHDADALDACISRIAADRIKVGDDASFDDLVVGGAYSDKGLMLGKWRLYVDSAGRLRIYDTDLGPIASDTAGTIIGGQS